MENDHDEVLPVAADSQSEGAQITYYTAGQDRPSEVGGIPLPRRGSVILIAPSGAVPVLFSEAGLLGRGSGFFVRKFSNGDPTQDLAVKAGTDKFITYGNLRGAEKEFDYYRDGYSEADVLAYQVVTESNGRKNCRLIRPDFGISLFDILSNATGINNIDNQEKLKMILAALHGLQFWHSKGRIHGDLNAKNVLIKVIGDQYIAKWIDFEFAYKQGEPATCIDINLTKQGGEYWAPERKKTKENGTSFREPLGNFSQDIYSIAYTIGLLQFELLKKEENTIMHLRLPVVFVKLCLQALEIEPMKRPSLAQLIDALEKSLMKATEPPVEPIPQDKHAPFNLAQKQFLLRYYLVVNSSAQLTDETAWYVMSLLNDSEELESLSSPEFEDLMTTIRQELEPEVALQKMAL